MNEKIGGEIASLDNSRCEKEQRREVWKDDYPLVYVVYKDHVLFRNENPENITVSEREAIGWLVYQNSEEIVLLMDRSCNPQPSERIGRSSGLGILRSNIMHFSDLSKYMRDKLTSNLNIDRYTKKQVKEK